VSSVVREATADDAHAIAEVQVRTWHTAYRGLVSGDDLEGLSVERRAEFWTELLAAGDAAGFTLVAEDGDEVVGFCAVAAPARDEDLGPRAYEVAAIYVDPGRWRSGVGTSLLDAAVRRLDDGHWDEAALWVFRDNPRAQSFYAKHGFAPDGALRGDPDVPEVRLRRSLPRA